MSEEKSQNGQNDQINRKNLIKAITYIAIIIAIMGIVWLLPRVALGTDTPFFVVSGDSMLPTLHEGDYILVSGEHFDSLKEGDIIVFNAPTGPTVHRIVQICDSGEKLVVQGDNKLTNPKPDPWYVTKDNYIGKYTGFKIPYLGYLALLFPFPVNYILVIIVILIIFLIEFLPEKKENKVES